MFIHAILFCSKSTIEIDSVLNTCPTFFVAHCKYIFKCIMWKCVNSNIFNLLRMKNEIDANISGSNDTSIFLYCHHQYQHWSVEYIFLFKICVFILHFFEVCVSVCVNNVCPLNISSRVLKLHLFHGHIVLLHTYVYFLQLFYLLDKFNSSIHIFFIWIPLVRELLSILVCRFVQVW